MSATVNIPVKEFYETYTCIDSEREEYEHNESKRIVVLVFESDDYIIVRYK